MTDLTPREGPHSMMLLFDHHIEAGDNQGPANLTVPSGSLTQLKYWRPHVVPDASGQFVSHTPYNEAPHFECVAKGIYLVTFQVVFPSHVNGAKGERGVYVYEKQNGKAERRGAVLVPASVSGTTQLSLSCVLSLSGPGAGQSFTEFYVYQTSGAAMVLVQADKVAPRVTQTWLRSSPGTG